MCVTDRLGLRPLSSLDLPLDRTDTANFLFQLTLGVAVGLVDRQRRLAQVVEMAKLVGHTLERLGGRLAD